MPPTSSTEQRLTRLEERLNSHFDTVETDREARREIERDFAQQVKVLGAEVFELKTLLASARLSGKILIGVASVVGGLVAWIVGLYRAKG